MTDAERFNMAMRFLSNSHDQVLRLKEIVELFCLDIEASQRTWVGLTYEEQRELYKKHEMDGWGHFYNAIEAKLKEKNVSTL